MSDNLIRTGFIVAGVINIAGALGTSMAFTNPELGQADPTAMSNFGLLGIILWGLAYIATANHWREAKWLAAVFSLEKALYAVHWAMWIQGNQDTLKSLFERDFMSGLFFSIYGPTDLLLAIFFAYVFVKASKPATA